MGKRDHKRPGQRTRSGYYPAPNTKVPSITRALRDLLWPLVVIAFIGVVLHYIVSSKLKVSPKELIDHQGRHSSARFTIKNVGLLRIRHIHYFCEVLNFSLGVGEREDQERKKIPVVGLPQAEIPEMSRGEETPLMCTFPAKLTELSGYEILIRLSYDPQFLNWLPRNDQFRFRIDRSPEGRYSLIQTLNPNMD